jgi:DNA-binding transcriptional LysR family regulator
MFGRSMLDWDDLRFFLAVARQGTMSAAARSLRVAQPTVGRRIAAFERTLGAQLPLRSSDGWTLSPTGRDLLAHAERMEHEALAAETLATGRDEGVEGKLRITASEWLVRSVLGPALAPFVQRNPGLQLELIADPRHLNLARREADLALRPSRFQQNEVHQRALAIVEFGLYAADAYVKRYGVPDFTHGCEGHSLVAMSAEPSPIVEDVWLARSARRARVAVRVNGREAMATVAAAGIGMACLPRVVGDAVPGLRMLATPGERPTRKLWLGVHRAARSMVRVRETVGFLVGAFEALQPVLAPHVAAG